MGLPFHVIDKIINYHLPILNKIRSNIGKPLIISENSGYRPIQWEIANGRSGNSQHTFKRLGAVDVTSSDFEALIHECKKSDYKRIAIYYDKKFVHLDHNAKDKQIFNVIDGKWELI